MRDPELDKIVIDDLLALAAEEPIEEVKTTKTQQIMDFLVPPKTDKELEEDVMNAYATTPQYGNTAKQKYSHEDHMIAIREGREMDYLMRVEE